MLHRKMIWLTMKGLSFVCIGGIVYSLYCMTGVWPGTIGTRMVTRVIPLLLLYYFFDLIAKHFKTEWGVVWHWLQAPSNEFQSVLEKDPWTALFRFWLLYNQPCPSVPSQIWKRVVSSVAPGGFSGLGISSSIAFVVLHIDAAKSPDFDPVATWKSIGHFIKEELNNLLGFGAWEAGFLSQSIYELRFGHMAPPRNIS